MRGLLSFLAGLFRRAPGEKGAVLGNYPEIPGSSSIPVLTPSEAPRQPVPGVYQGKDALTLALPLIQHYEACKLAPYKDAAGIPTIGWGNTRWEDGRAVTMMDKTITQGRADALFAHWLGAFDRDVAKLLPADADAGTRAAFLSFAYNVGVAGAKGSTALKRLVAGDKAGAAAGLAMWTKSGGKVLKGLQRRRHAEGLVLLGEGVKVAIIKAEVAFP